MGGNRDKRQDEADDRTMRKGEEPGPVEENKIKSQAAQRTTAPRLEEVHHDWRSRGMRCIVGLNNTRRPCTGRSSYRPDPFSCPRVGFAEQANDTPGGMRRRQALESQGSQSRGHGVGASSLGGRLP